MYIKAIANYLLGYYGIAICGVAVGILSMMAIKLPSIPLFGGLADKAFPGILVVWILAFLMVFFIVAINNQKVILFFIIAIAPFQRSFLAHYGLFLSGFIIFGAFAVLLSKMLIKKAIFKIHSVQLLALAMLTYSAISLVIQGMNRGNLFGSGGLIYLMQSVEAFLFCLLISNLIDTKRNLHKGIFTIMLLGFVFSMVGLQQIIMGENLFRNLAITEHFLWNQGRIVEGIFYDPNHFANFSVTTCFVLFPFLFSNIFRSKIFVMVTLVFLILCLHLTYSVANLLAFFLCLPFFLLCCRGRFYILISMTCMLSLTILCVPDLASVLISYLPEAIRYKVVALINFQPSEASSFDIRMRLNRVAWEMFCTHPLCGNGYGTFQRIIQNTPAFFEFTKGQTWSHNSYLLVLAELGIVGASLLLLFLYHTIKVAVQNIKEIKHNELKLLQTGILTGIVTNLIFFISYGSLMYNMNFWLLIGLTIALRQITTNEKEIRQAERKN